MSAQATTFVEVGVAAWTLAEQSGDRYALEPFENGLLLAVVDGLGHGPAAARAATAAVATLASDPAAEPARLAQLCHEALRGTRGAVASLASVTARGTMTWLGVGNVEGVLIGRRGGRPSQVLGSRGGVLGHDLPALHSATVPIAPGDTLVLATDGIDPSILWRLELDGSAQANADRILAEGGKRDDDALVLVARYLGATR